MHSREKAAPSRQVHPIAPVYDENSRILILGSFPSVKSREAAFFYGHRQNRFWKVTAAVFHAAVPETTEEKRAFLLAHHVALWDVIASCEICRLLRQQHPFGCAERPFGHFASRADRPHFYKRRHRRPALCQISSAGDRDGRDRPPLDQPGPTPPGRRSG